MKSGTIIRTIIDEQYSNSKALLLVTFFPAKSKSLFNKSKSNLNNFD